MVDRSVLESINSYFFNLKKNNIPVSFGVLFGSYARGNADESSDIDLVIVSPRFDRQGSKLPEILTLWRIAARTDSRIEPVHCGENEWRKKKNRMIIEIARQEGEILRPQEDSF